LSILPDQEYLFMLIESHYGNGTGVNNHIALNNSIAHGNLLDHNIPLCASMNDCLI